MDNFRAPSRPSARYTHGRSRPLHIGSPPRPVQSAAPHSAALTAQPNASQTKSPLQSPDFNQPQHVTKTINLGFKRPRSPMFIKYAWQVSRRPLRDLRVRLALITIVLVLIVSFLIPALQPYLAQKTYALGSGESLLQKKDTLLANKLKLNNKTGDYDYNADYNITNQTTDSKSGGPLIKAVVNQDPVKGLKVTDPISSAAITLKPKFSLMAGKQDGNRVIYPLMNGTGWLVYTMQATGVKEDIILRYANGDKMTLDYGTDLEEQGLEARLQKDGSVAIYGSSSPLNGTVATGDSKDSALLQKARERAKKDKFLFELPTPTVYEAGHTTSKKVHTIYKINNGTISTVTTGLKQASFPLDVDPAVTVVGISDLFRDSNPDSNVDLSQHLNQD